MALRGFRNTQEEKANVRYLCPCCGKDTMAMPIAKNGISSYADVRICSDCIKADKNIPFDRWAYFASPSSFDTTVSGSRTK